MTGYRLRLPGTALTDLLLRDSLRRSNVQVSLPYVPGAALRGHLAQRWLRGGGTDDATFRSIFESGRTVFHDTHPTLGDEPATIVPFSFRTCKTHERVAGHLIGDTLSIAGVPRCEHESHGSMPVATKRLSGSVTPDGRIIRPAERMSNRSRIGTVDDAEGSGVAADQSLFTERRLSAGTDLVFEITGPKDDLEQLAELLAADGDVITVGRARSVLGVVETRELSITPLASHQPLAGDEHTLTFLSHTILLDTRHRYLTAVGSPDVLAAVLQAELRRPVDAKAVEVMAAGVRSTTVGGWDLREGGPKPIEVAVAAGSVIRFRTTDTDTIASLAEATCIGWRRAEGFGRIAVDHPVHQLELQPREDRRAPEPTPRNRERIATEAQRTATKIHDEHKVTRSLWQGIEDTVRSGQIPQPQQVTVEPDSRDATRTPDEAAENRSNRRAQSSSSRGARAGRDQRGARNGAIELFIEACQHLEFGASGPQATTLADDIGRELDLLAQNEKAGR